MRDDLHFDMQRDFMEEILGGPGSPDIKVAGGLAETHKYDILSNPDLSGKLTTLTRILERAKQHNRNAGPIHGPEDMQKLSKVLVFSRSVKLLE